MPSLPSKNVFMIGLNEFNHEKLKSIRNFDSYTFHGLIPPEEAEDADDYNIPVMLNELEKKLIKFNGSVDAIVTYIDFPISMMTPILRPKFGLTSPSLESILKCQHKYWGRVVQKEIVPDAVPRFCALDPFADDPYASVDLKFPFWLKPVKSVGSYLGFRIKNRREFDRAVGVIRKYIGRMAEPFNAILDRAEVPAEIRKVDGSFCIAEQIIGGRQCTLEGYVFNGKVNIYGVVDSIRHANKSTFFHYDYPSRLPVSVQKRMTAITEDVLAHIGYDNHPFNIEFFWNQSTGKIWLLEINTRISQSHSDLFEKVDGASNHQITVELGMGRDPAFPKRKGEYNRASKFFYRKWEDAIVTRVPTPEEIAEIQRDVPGSLIDVKVAEGVRLYDLNEQDSYSYDLAWIFLGANNYRDLGRKYRECVERLRFEFKQADLLPPGQRIESQP
ncbi:ATP-grasp domain-containing protein [Natronogracilivirga saccharolytica]|uniref:ATP-grasp domain-containing protein n=1 Tax=Natronogracilivirga saccharolytica TaxID=2812953 RepID=A0A8J7RJR9_9BACT|nr:ATP-grasp domain-containing protein [Natronogracilivirga saccharolytica]MBP3193015.1 ATP-grasp domain-containing protein [Natronogracilivirga saccharolytica]